MFAGRNLVSGRARNSNRSVRIRRAVGYRNVVLFAKHGNRRNRRRAVSAYSQRKRLAVCAEFARIDVERNEVGTWIIAARVKERAVPDAIAVCVVKIACNGFVSAVISSRENKDLCCVLGHFNGNVYILSVIKEQTVGIGDSVCFEIDFADATVIIVTVTGNSVKTVPD